MFTVNQDQMTISNKSGVGGQSLRNEPKAGLHRTEGSQARLPEQSKSETDQYMQAGDGKISK